MNQPHPANPWPAPPAQPAPSNTRKTMKRLGLAGAFLVTFLFGYSVGNTPLPEDSASAASYNAPATPAYDSLPTYSAPAPTTEALAPAPTPTAQGIGEGDYLVGSEVEPGKYRSTGAKPGFIELCSASTKTADGNVMEWETANANEPVLITVSSKAETFSNAGCEPFVKVG